MRVWLGSRLQATLFKQSCFSRIPSSKSSIPIFGAGMFALCLLYHGIREAVTKKSFEFRPLSNAEQLNLGDSRDVLCISNAVKSHV